MKPFIKWLGGKTKLLPELLKRLPSDFDARNYVEPFCGGAALFWATAERRKRFSTLRDANVDLIIAYQSIRENVDTVIDKLADHARWHSADAAAHYYATRAAFNASRPAWSDAERAAAFIYLNKTCFNGLWRVNRKNELNAALGDYTDPKILDADALRAACRALNRTVIIASPFEDSLSLCDERDFVYLDPPYAPLTKGSDFTAYTANGFGPGDQMRLGAWLTELDRRGAKWLLSNSDTPETRELYKAWRIDSVRCARSINRDASKRGAVGEILVSNYEAAE